MTKNKYWIMLGLLYCGLLLGFFFAPVVPRAQHYLKSGIYYMRLIKHGKTDVLITRLHNKLEPPQKVVIVEAYKPKTQPVVQIKTVVYKKQPLVVKKTKVVVKTTPKLIPRPIILEGRVVKNYPEGMLLSETYYVHGRKDGWERTYFKNGALKLEVPYTAGLKNGVARRYYSPKNKQGGISQVFGFLFGWLNPSAQNNDRGQLAYEMSYQNDRIEGRVKSYYKSGFPKWDMNYQNGLLNGQSKLYYENGNLKAIIDFKDGIAQGQPTGYTAEGSIIPDIQ